MKEKLCLALAMSQTEALFPGRFRSRESGLMQHWRLNAPPTPSIYIPRDGVLVDRNVFHNNKVLIMVKLLKKFWSNN